MAIPFKVEIRLLVAVFVLCFVSQSNVFAQIPTGQDAGAVQRDLLDKKKQDKLTRELTEKKKETEIEEPEVERPRVPAKGGPTVLISKIEVEGSEVLKQSEIREIVSPYENSEMDGAGFQRIASLITTEYRKRGFVTSFAYLPKQKVSDGVLRISVLEGTVGELNVDGNKWFSERMINNYLDMNKNEMFNYETLRRNVARINEKRDVNAKVYLAKGKERGQTNINVKVEDKFPFHLNLGFNNHNSKYTERLKYTAELLSTNFLGLGHMLSAEMQIGESGRYNLYTARYLAPVFSNGTFGFSYINLNQRLGREVGDLEIKGEGDVINVYYSHTVFENDNLSISINPGFVYKDIFNEVIGTTDTSVGGSEDRLRIAKLGMDIDYTDSLNGRTILSQEFDFGVKDFLGGLSSDDPHASRSGVGAGGKFFKSVTNVARIQALPLDMALMFKGTMQLTADDLPSTEQFFIGGPSSVRGYPNSEHGGDKGYFGSAEVFVPLYGLPKDLELPFSDATWYDSLRLSYFFDWGFVSTNNVVVGEAKRETLYSCGPALSFDIPNKFSLSLDYGITLGQRSSDGSKSRLYLETKLYF